MSEQIEKLTLAQLERFDMTIAKEGDGYEYIVGTDCLRNHPEIKPYAVKQ